MREGIKEKREERNRIGRRGKKKLGKEGGKKRETGQEVKERESYVGSYQNHVCANLFHFLDTSIRTTGCWTAS